MHSWKNESQTFQNLKEDRNPSVWRAWLYAMRPKTLTAAIIPMVCGSALAYNETGMVFYFLTICGILSAGLIQIGTNLVNDALDYKKGVDTNERLGPKRASQSGWLSPSQVLAIGVACLTVSIICGIPLIAVGGWPIFWTVFISAILGYLYTGGPRPLSYNGMGDLFVFLFFGLVATGAIFYVQTGYLSWKALLLGTQLGLICTIMIAINNLRDAKEDAKTEKRTLAVRFGVKFVKTEITLLVITPYLLGLIWWQVNAIGAAIWPLLTLPLAIFLLTNINTHNPSKVYNIFLGQASILYLLWGIALTAGFIV